MQGEAQRLGWLAYHTWDSRGSSKGFPDLVLVKPGSHGIRGVTGHGRVIFAELKTRTGKLTQEQATWLSILRQTGRVEVYEWRPQEWADILRILADMPVCHEEGGGTHVSMPDPNSLE